MSSQASLIHKAWRVLRTRPVQFLASLRCYLMFWCNYQIRRILQDSKSGVSLGSNVRLQRFRSISCERPDARIQVAANTIIYEHARLEAFGSGKITIGEDCILGDVRICSREKVTFGDRVITSWNVFIQDFDPHPLPAALRAKQVEKMVRDFQPSFNAGAIRATQDFQNTFHSRAIEVGDDVWIGANVVILKGAVIGQGCVIAAGAVVPAGNYAADCVIAGNPATVIKSTDLKSSISAMRGGRG